MANWKKVIVSGSSAELAQITASSGINIQSLKNGNNSNYILTVNTDGTIEQRDPTVLGTAFQSASIDSPDNLGDFSTDSFIAKAGLNELVFVSGSNIQLHTSQSLTDANSDSVGYIKITALTSSIAATVNQTTVEVDKSVYTVGTVQDISTGSSVAFASVSASGDITGANLAIAGDIVHIGDADTKIGFGTDEVNITTGGTARVHIDSNGLEVAGDITASGTITASALRIENDAQIQGDLALGGTIFSLAGFGVTIDDVAITSGSVNFGSGSAPSNNDHKFTGSLSVTGSGITLTDGVFAGDGNSLTNLDADNLVDTHDLTWGSSLTQSVGQGSAYNVTTSIQLNVHISGSANSPLTSSKDGLYIQGKSIQLHHLTASDSEGQLITFSGSDKKAHYIGPGSAGQVLTSLGSDNIPEYQDLPASTGLGIETGSVDDDLGNGVQLIVTSSVSTVINRVRISGSNNQITVSGSHDRSDNLITLRLADNITNISTVTASAGIKTGFIQATDITASGDLTVAGNFTVQGDTTLLHTTNLLVEDAFITLASGSSQADGGIIVQTGETAGRSFGWDNTIGRWVTQDNVNFNVTDITPTELIMSTFISASNPTIDTEPNYGQASPFKKYSSGQFWINTGSGDIWIYVD
jgi:hypothetical protein